MKWYDTDEFWPGKDARNIIVDGRALLYLKPEYVGNVHEPDSKGRVYDQFGIWVNYYCPIEDPIPWIGEFEDNINIEHALFYDIYSYCCNVPERLQAHEDHCRSIGLFYDNIRKFVKKSDLKASMDSVSQWAFLGEE